MEHSCFRLCSRHRGCGEETKSSQSFLKVGEKETTVLCGSVWILRALQKIWSGKGVGTRGSFPAESQKWEPRGLAGTRAPG